MPVHFFFLNMDIKTIGKSFVTSFVTPFTFLKYCMVSSSDLFSGFFNAMPFILW